MINTTGDFKSIIRKTFSQDANQSIKRAFQAIRIATNYELLNIEKFLEQQSMILDKNSMLMVITFHSLEERMISQQFHIWKKESLGDLGTKKPLMPSAEEYEENPRSKSAKLYTFLFQ